MLVSSWEVSEIDRQTYRISSTSISEFGNDKIHSVIKQFAVTIVMVTFAALLIQI